MLIILEHLMYKLKVEENLPAIPHPCDYFDLIGGTSTGGMGIEDAVKAYGQLAKEVFSDVKPLGSNGRFKASKLEKAIKEIVRAKSALQDPEERLEDIQNNACKMFVCTTTVVNMSLPVLLRTYNTPDYPATDCTIWQAGRATSAVPTFFKQIQIGRPGLEEAFLDGGMGHNNPTAALLLEAKVLFPDKQIACIISLGTGQPHTINIPKPSLLNWFIPLDVVKAIQKIATDYEKEHQSLAHRFDGVAKLYFLFNVERGMQDIQLNQWEGVAANTRQYIQSQPVVKQLADAVMSLTERIGRVSTTNLTTAAALDGVKQSEAPLAFVRCPPSSQIFQGRQDILAKMTEYFSKDIGTRHIYVLHGLGGSGKTQISLKFLDTANCQPTPRFTKQFFINASSLQTLDTAFKNIAIAHKIGNSLQDALSWLITQIEEWMLLFDNADDTNINLFPFFPRCTHGNIIITSRNPQLTVHGPTSHSKVGDMDEIDAIDLLLLRAAKEYSAETAKKALEIVKELSCLPLAIIQAGAYISKFDCFDQYLSIYQQHRVRLLQEWPGQFHDDYEWTVYTTWQISFKKLSPLAAEFLQMCSLLHYKNITEDIFKQAAAWTAKNEVDAQTVQEARSFLWNFLSASGSWDLLSFMQILAEIKGYSLLDTHGGNTFSIHPIVHLWCRTTLKDEPKARECMADILGMSVGLTDDRFQFRIGLMPHVDTLIQSPAVVKPMFQSKYAWIYSDLGKFREAEHLETNVLEKQKTLLGVDHPDTLQLGRYQEAELLQATVLEKRKTLLGADHPDTLLAMANLASTYSELGRYQEAQLLKATVLEKWKTLLGADHPDTLLAMANLASTYSELGRYQEAELLKATILEKRKILLGADHPDMLAALENLLATYYGLAKYQEAKELQAQYDHTYWFLVAVRQTMKKQVDILRNQNTQLQVSP
ncbi:hypothetical protein DFH08DRAFT_927988 [Mycena albidolilacea]|uniref:PNPLA domain-containing protein n=1 Tax=Mycena albidolilacea TaxID=1033008 RepID=A0AAD7F3H1_9AGAR|nr:hypothetical protein DFH08DRAFT_927988 [Mycena albidolilacea]